LLLLASKASQMQTGLFLRRVHDREEHNEK